MNAGRAIVGNTIMKWGRDDDVGAGEGIGANWS